MANAGSWPSSGATAVTRRGRSRSISWRCNAMVAVATTTVLRLVTAYRMAGTR